jgi:hypothetical protein
MNRNLDIKLSNSNFIGWRTQILAYIRGQDAYGFLNDISCVMQIYYQLAKSKKGSSSITEYF